MEISNVPIAPARVGQRKGGVKTGRSDRFKNAGECLFFKLILKKSVLQQKASRVEKQMLLVLSPPSLLQLPSPASVRCPQHLQLGEW